MGQSMVWARPKWSPWARRQPSSWQVRASFSECTPTAISCSADLLGGFDQGLDLLLPLRALIDAAGQGAGELEKVGGELLLGLDLVRRAGEAVVGHADLQLPQPGQEVAEVGNIDDRAVGNLGHDLLAARQPGQPGQRPAAGRRRRLPPAAG